MHGELVIAEGHEGEDEDEDEHEDEHEDWQKYEHEA